MVTSNTPESEVTVWVKPSRLVALSVSVLLTSPATEYAEPSITMLEIASVFAESDVEDELQLEIIAIATAEMMVALVIFRKLIMNSEGKTTRRCCQVRSRRDSFNEHIAIFSGTTALFPGLRPRHEPNVGLLF
jgi:hypothetical protein